MDTQHKEIPAETFASCLRLLPQVSVELLVERDGEVLLARRLNEPAKDEWFVPGSRLYKGESFSEAVDRIAAEELGIEVKIISQLGAFNHFWQRGAFPSVEETHTVNVVYHVRPSKEAVVQLDDQHGDYIFSDGSDIDLHPQIIEYLQLAGLRES